MATQHKRRLTLTVHEAAEELRVSDRTVWKLINSGELPSIKVGGSRRIVHDVLDAYVARLTKKAG